MKSLETSANTNEANDLDDFVELFRPKFENPLVQAAYDQDIEKVDQLLAMKADPNQLDRSSRSALNACMTWPCENTKYILHLLITAKADPNTVDTLGNTSLHHICSADVRDTKHSAELIQMLGKTEHRGLIADINHQNVIGYSALHYATATFLSPDYDTEDTSIIRALLDINVNPSIQAHTDNTELVNRDIAGNTALMFAIKGKNLELVELLCKNTRPQDLDIQSASGKTAFDYAKEKSEKPEIMHTLMVYLNKARATFLFQQLLMTRSDRIGRFNQVPKMIVSEIFSFLGDYGCKAAEEAQQHVSHS